jgi:hypothetical protein
MSDLVCEDDHCLVHDTANLCDIPERLKRGREEARGVKTTQSSPPSSATVLTVLQPAHSHIHNYTHTYTRTHTHTHTHARAYTHTNTHTYTHK